MNHRILVVEDDDVFGAQVCALLQGGGFDTTLVRTKRDALEALGREGFCMMLADLGLPADGRDPLRALSTGQRLVEETALLFPHVNEKLKRLFQIMVMTGLGRQAPEIVRTMQVGASEYVLKPPQHDFIDRVRQCLRHAGRSDHALCAGLPTYKALPREPLIVRAESDRLTPASGMHVAVRRVHLVLTGRACPRQRGEVLLQDGTKETTIEVRGMSYEILLLLAARRQEDGDGWVKGHEIGAHAARYVSYLRLEELGPVLGAHLDPIESVDGAYRFARHVVVAPLDAQALQRAPWPIANAVAARLLRRT